MALGRHAARRFLSGHHRASEEANMSAEKRPPVPVEGHPGIYHLPGSSRFPAGGYLVRWRDPNGNHHRRTFAAKQDAIAFHQDTKTDIRRGEYRDDRRGQRLFAEIASEWLAGKPQLKRPKTLFGYESILRRHLLPEFGHRAIGSITHADVQAFISGLSARSAATRHNVLSVLKPIMRHAVREGLISANPCDGVEVGPIEFREMLFLTETEVAALIDAIAPEYRAFVLMAAYTGMRQGELHALRVGRVDLMRARVTVTESASVVRGEVIYGPPKSKHGRRTIAIPRFLVDALGEIVADKVPEDLVFTSPSGAPFRHDVYYGRHFKPAVRRALPPEKHGLRFHDLRHTHVAMLIAQGVHPKAISARLGHGSISITMDRYGHLMDDHEEPIMAAIEASYRQTAKEGARLTRLSAVR
jgi:integrase